MQITLPSLEVTQGEFTNPAKIHLPFSPQVTVNKFSATCNCRKQPESAGYMKYFQKSIKMMIYIH